MTTSDTRLRRWQAVTVATLFTGYAGYYVCRSVLPVASNQMIADPALGLDKVGYGRLVAVGIYVYVVGKLCNGVLTEYVGGRVAFLAGMVLSAACVAAFGLAGGLTAFLVLWAANRFVQSAGWVALVQITGRWFRPGSLATVMGVLCLSYLFGDALARLYLGAFARVGVGWRELFFIAAGTVAVLALVGSVALRSSPKALGLPEPPPPPGNVFGDGASGDSRLPLGRLLRPLLASPMFWLVCLMNAGLTAVRETFNAWTPLYLEQGVGLSGNVSGLLSFVFPFAGAVASLAAGWGADRLGGRYGRLLVPLMALTTAALGWFATADLQGNAPLALGLIAAVALFVMGPYTFCSGVLALNLGGKQAAAASAGLIDAAGYVLGAIIAGELAGHLVEAHGFTPLWRVLFVVSAVTLVVAVVYWVAEERRR
jgi:OPA family glycerol-3-phosphate transporter-like MFS transporter